MAKRLGRINEHGLIHMTSVNINLSQNIAWTMAHTFFVIMGGFHFYDGKPLDSLSPADVLNLIKCGTLVPPTSDELADKSKGDALSKSIAVGQTLWSVTQLVARWIQHLPFTNLEVMTLAYTILTVAMYTAWWHKPLNVSCPVRVPQTAEEPVKQGQGRGHGKWDWGPPVGGPRAMWRRAFDYVMGDQDELIELKWVIEFWLQGSGGIEDDYEDEEEDDGLSANTIILLVAMAFGALHCIAWHAGFPSPLEQQMWRVSAIIIIAVPVVMFLGYVVFACIAIEILAYSCFTAYTLAYIAARFILLSLPLIQVIWVQNFIR